MVNSDISTNIWNKDWHKNLGKTTYTGRTRNTHYKSSNLKANKNKVFKVINKGLEMLRKSRSKFICVLISNVLIYMLCRILDRYIKNIDFSRAVASSIIGGGGG